MRSSSSGTGVYGRSSGFFGVVADGDDSSATDTDGDLLLAGTRGEIHSGQYLNIYSDYHVRIDLDHDNNQSDAHFVVLNGQDQVAMQLEENGDLEINGSLTKSGGGFRIDHPLDPENQYLNHSFVESPDMMNVYNGNVTLDASGEAWVELPDWFEALNRDFRYQLTCIGAFAPVYVAQEIEDNRFQIAGGTPGLKVSWQVTGIRHDPYAEANRIPVEEEKPPEAQGTYLHPVVYGKPETSALGYGGGWRRTMKRAAVLAVIVALLLLGSVTVAQSGGHDPPAWYTVEQGMAFGGGYRLTGLSWRVEGTASGKGYHLLVVGPASPTLQGNGCCCTWLPCVLRNR